MNSSYLSWVALVSSVRRINNMSKFTSFVSVHIPNKYSEDFTLTEDLAYELFWEWSDKFMVVPWWFQTNFGSFPILLQIFFKPWDRRWILGTIIHDYLWTGRKTLKEYQYGSDVFFEAIQVTGTPKYLAHIMYLMVSLTKYGYWVKNELAILHNKI